MLIDAFILLTFNKIKSNISFSLDTFTTLLQPVLWLSIFLILRENSITLQINNNEIKYIDFLVLGIFVWRIVSFIIGRFPSMIQEDTIPMRSIMISPGGRKVLLWSCIATTFSIAMLIGLTMMLASILLYGFSIYLNFIFYAIIVFLICIIIHFEIALIFFFLRMQRKNLKSLGFIATTMFGLFSGVFFPINLFPFPLNDISYFLPLTQSLILMRELLLYPEPVLNWYLLLILSLETVFIFGITIALYKRNFLKSNLEK